MRRNDPAGLIRFEPLDSARGLTLSPGGESVLVVEHERTLTGSDAALALGRRMRFPYPLLARAAAQVPKPLRDRAYAWVAANRYRWFGRCEAPPPGSVSPVVECPCSQDASRG